MKYKPLVCLIYFLFIVVSYSVAQQKIRRIGSIKLGMSFNELVDTLELNRWSFIDPNFSKVRDQDLQQPKRNYLLYYDKDLSLDLLPFYKKCKDAVLVILEKVVIPGSTLTIRNVQLAFYMDSLVEVRINDPSQELITLIKRRYGKGAERKEEGLSSCPYPYGGYTKKEIMTCSAWGDPEGATLNYMSFSWVTKLCESKITSYVQFYLNEGLQSLDHCIENLR